MAYCLSRLLISYCPYERPIQLKYYAELFFAITTHRVAL